MGTKLETMDTAKGKSLTGHAQRDHALKFISLAHLLDADYLRDCYRSLNRNRAVGIDSISWEEYGANLDDNLSHLVSRLKRKRYKPLVVATKMVVLSRVNCDYIVGLTES